MILLYFTPLRYLVVHNIFSHFVKHQIRKIFSLPRISKYLALNVYPVIPAEVFNKFGLHAEQVAYFMYRWNNMVLSPDKIYSIENGYHAYCIGLKNFWGKTSFLDPSDTNRYQLWAGLYMVCLKDTYELKGENKIKAENFGYDPVNKDFILEHAMILIQYDIYTHLDFIKKYLPQDLKDLSEDKQLEFFKIKEVKVQKKEYFEDQKLWKYKLTAITRSIMLYQDSLDYKAFSSQHAFGWVPKNNEKNFDESFYKCDLVCYYIDENGNKVHPASGKAKVLNVSYVFGIRWEDGKKETPGPIMEELYQSLINIQFKENK